LQPIAHSTGKNIEDESIPEMGITEAVSTAQQTSRTFGNAIQQSSLSETYDYSF